MSAEIDYVAVRDDLKKRIEQLQAALAGVEGILAATSLTGSQRVSSAQDIARDEFLGMTIPDAAKKYLEVIRTPQTIGQIWEGLKQGGLPHIKYNAVYTAIWRRVSPDGDFARVDETLWGLAAWYKTIPNVKKKDKAKAAKPAVSDPPQPKGDESGTKISRKRGGFTMLDACEQILRKADRPLHAEKLVEKLLADYEKGTNVKSIAGTLPQDGQGRFVNLGRNVWALTEWPESKLKIQPQLAATA
jgi:DNA-directed RNA polymerase delta subunit